MFSDQMRQAYDLIKQGKKREAVAVLQPILKADRSNADAWWLLANALTEPDKQIQALRQLIALRPDDGRAHRMLERLQEELRPKEDDFSFEDAVAASADDDPFASSSSSASSSSFGSDDPFMSSSSAAPRPKRAQSYETFAPPPKRSGTNPVLVILAIVGVLTLACCGISAVALSRAGIEIGNVVQQFVLTITADPDAQNLFGTLVAGGTPGGSSFDRSDARGRGAIDVGQSISGDVDTFEDDYYTLTGSSGLTITINVESTSDVDPQLSVYDSDNQLLGSNDDIDMSSGNMDSRLTLTLPSNGTYYIVVSAFGSGGTYTIRVSR